MSRRLSVYDEQTLPLIEHYRAQGLLRSIDAMGSVGEVESRLHGRAARRAERGRQA